MRNPLGVFAVHLFDINLLDFEGGRGTRQMTNDCAWQNHYIYIVILPGFSVWGVLTKS